MRIKKGDTVKILYGRDAGKTGKVLKVIAKEKTVIVDGLNIVTKHLKGNGKDIKSEIVKLVKPVNMAKVSLICPSCGKATRVKNNRDDKGKAIRVCIKCGKALIETVSEAKPKAEIKKTEAKKAVKKEKAEKKTEEKNENKSE